jgi:GT2 family glycosyltransferase
VELIASSENLGFAQANNVAAARARGRRLLLLNPDTVVLDRAIDELHRFAEEHPANRIWGGITVHGDMRLDPTSCWRRMTLWSLFCRASGLTKVFQSSDVFNPELQPRWQRDDVREVDIVTGCFLLIDTDLWTELGGFDPAFFMYAEEADLCLRARAAGARPLHCPGARIVHYGGASERIPEDRLVKILRAKTLLIRKHWRGLSRWLGVKLMGGWALTNSLASRALRLLGKDSDKQQVWIAAWQRREDWLI